MEKRKCQECNETFTGRIDKKFCSDQCRNTYNNRLNSDSSNHVRNINNILRKNRRILQELNPVDKAKVSKEKMLTKGFNFSYYTNTLITAKGATYYFCYEYGYLPLDEKNYFLVINNRGRE
jgi:hypothetical protein